MRYNIETNELALACRSYDLDRAGEGGTAPRRTELALGLDLVLPDSKGATKQQGAAAARPFAVADALAHHAIGAMSF